MINCINFLPQGINIKNLKKYERSEKILASLSHLDIPILDVSDKEDFNDEDENNFIVETDLLIYCTPNSADMSYLQFYLYDQEENDFILHHDIYVFSSINDAAYISLCNNHYIALATYEDNLMLYDALVENPMTPQILFKGHSGPIMSICMDDDTLYSGGKDKEIIRWDIEKELPSKMFHTNVEIDKICIMDDNIIYTNKNNIFLHCTDLQVNTQDTVENIKFQGKNVYISDSSGMFYKYDIRNFKQAVFENKIFKSAATGMDILNDQIGLCSKEGEIKIIKKDGYTDIYDHKVNFDLFSLKLHPDNIIFFNDDNDNLIMKKYN